MKKKTWNIIIRHVVLALLAFIWLIPIVWLVVTSVVRNKGRKLPAFLSDNTGRWQISTSCSLRRILLQTSRHGLKIPLSWHCLPALSLPAFVLMVSYAFSCMRFKGRKQLMSFSIILGMFPGVLSMIAVYFVLKMIGLTDSLAGLIIVYSAGSWNLDSLC